jgi:two-component system CheB/CheR fusion protein
VIIFSEQDMIVDPPFSRLDLISCRNLLIYMDVDLQKKVISLFHYALNQSGFLFLGNSETIGEFTDLFNPVNRKWKLYQRKAAVTPRPVLTRDSIPLLPKEAMPARATVAGRREIPKSIRELTEQALLRQYAPAAVVINERGEILYIHGRTGKYLEPALGEASVDIVRMAREGLRRELTSGIRKVVAKKEPVHYEGLRIQENGDRTIVNLTIQPVADQPGDQPGLLLVTFKEVLPEEEVRPQSAEETVADGLDMQRDEKIKALEQELQEKEEYLQATVEELETSTEELQSTNEEMQSANEELQSTNEELETSKEELQSINEEMSTVNAELQQKVDDLSRVSNDMHNLLIAINVGTIFVDHQLCVKFFNTAASRVFNFIQSDVGRPLGHVVSNLVGYDGMVENIQAVLSNLIPQEAEVKTREGLWYLMRILPYRTLENVINGAVVTFVDITERKKFEEALREVNSLRRLAAVVRDSNDAITVHDLEGRIIAWNPGAERVYGWNESEALAMNIREITAEDHRKKLLALINKLARGVIIAQFQTKRLAKSGKAVDIWLTATALVKETGEIYAIATTERKKEGKLKGYHETKKES